MAILKRNKADNVPKPHKGLLTRGTEVKAEALVSRDDIYGTTAADNREPERITEPVNVRVDNHIRNQINALINLNFGDSAREVIGAALDSVLDRLDETQQRQYNTMVELYEKQDLYSWRKRKEKKAKRK